MAPKRMPAERLLKAAFARLEAYRVKAAAHAAADYPVRMPVHSLQGEMRRDLHERESVRPLPDMLRLGEGVPLRDEIAETHRRLERMRAGLAKLPRRNAEAFRLHRIEGMSYRQIGHTLGIPTRTVERQVAGAALFLASWSEGC